MTDVSVTSVLSFMRKHRFGPILGSTVIGLMHALCGASSTQIWLEWPHAAQFQLCTFAARLAWALDLLHAARHCNRRSFEGPRTVCAVIHLLMARYVHEAMMG